MNQRVETGHKRLQDGAAHDSEWPAAWPERIAARYPLTAAPTANPSTPNPPPTSARTVLAALDEATPHTIPELLARTRLPARTLRHAMRWLEDRGVLERLTALGDARRNLVRRRQTTIGALTVTSPPIGSVVC